MKTDSKLSPSTLAASLIAVVAAISINALPVLAQDESATGYYSDGYKPITNNQFMGLSHNTPETYLFRAEMAINREQWGEAIKYLRRSMRGNDDDLDTHKYLAICLEKEMDAGAERDERLYKECVSEWLIVLRNLKGAEKGLAFKNGISPTDNKKWEDEQGAMMARQHLIQLCGREPGRYESNAKFIARVARPAEENVHATVMSKKPASLRSGVDQ